MDARPRHKFNPLTGDREIIEFNVVCPRWFCTEGIDVVVIGPRPPFPTPQPPRVRPSDIASEAGRDAEARAKSARASAFREIAAFCRRQIVGVSTASDYQRGEDAAHAGVAAVCEARAKAESYEMDGEAAG